MKVKECLRKFENAVTFGQAEKLRIVKEKNKNLHAILDKEKQVLEPLFEPFDKLNRLIAEYNDLNLHFCAFCYEQPENLVLQDNLLSQLQNTDFSKDEKSVGKGFAVGGTTSAASTVGIWSLVGTLGTASTGIPISTLSGVAASNATLAAIGGGSLASGGLGMFGGVCILSGAAVLVALPTMYGATTYFNCKSIEKQNNLIQKFLDEMPSKEEVEKIKVLLESKVEILEKLKQDLVEKIKKYNNFDELYKTIKTEEDSLNFKISKVEVQNEEKGKKKKWGIF